MIIESSPASEMPPTSLSDPTPLRRGNRLTSRTSTIAFVVDWLEDPHQAALLAGARTAANARGARLAVFAGGAFDSPRRSGTRRNHIYELIDPDAFDGAVISTGTLVFGTRSPVEALCKRFRGPVCSVAVELPGTSSVVIDNSAGMAEAIEHLIVAHGHRNIAFIRGPETNAEAEERYAAYRRALERNGITFDESLVTNGDFQREAGVRAVRTLFDERGRSLPSIDAIAGAADLMVMGARDELERRGIKVPSDVALVGFDDVPAARYLFPPLSSVRQPLEEQAAEAVGLVLRQLQGLGETQQLKLATQFFQRRSCGCQNGTTALSTRPGPSRRLGLEASWISRREVLVASLARAAQGEFSAAGRSWEQRLFNATARDLRGETGALLQSLDELLWAVSDAGGNVSASQGVISALRAELVACAGDDPDQLRAVESILHDARLLASSVIERSQAQKRLLTEERARRLSGASARLITIFDLSHLGESMRATLPGLGISSAYVARYPNESLAEAELMAAFGPWGTLDARRTRPRFSAERLVPERYREHLDEISYVVEPLVHGTQRIGFAVFELGESEAYTYEVLTEVIGAALHGALLRAELNQRPPSQPAPTIAPPSSEATDIP